MLNLLAVALNLFSVIEPSFVDIEKLGHEQYQDLYIQGQVVKKASYAERFLEKRFSIVQTILDRYTRPFTLLDVGAAQGYFSFRAAELYKDSIFVMLEGSNDVYPMISQQLASLCELNSYLSNIIWLDRPIVPSEIANLSQCEHFDVILLLNILHWFPQDWESLFSSLNRMGHVLIIEVPPLEKNLSPSQRNLRKQIHRFLAEKATEIHEGVPRHNDLSQKTTYYIIVNNHSFNLKNTTLLHNNFGDREHVIKCDYNSKSLIKKDIVPPYHTIETKWVPGINLITFLMFNGSYPTRDLLVKNLPIKKTHRDWMPNNMLVQSSKLILIDEDDPKNLPEGRGGSAFYSYQLEKLIKDLILTTQNKPQQFVREKFAKLIYKGK